MTPVPVYRITHGQGNAIEVLGRLAALAHVDLPYPKSMAMLKLLEKAGDRVELWDNGDLICRIERCDAPKIEWPNY